MESIISSKSSNIYIPFGIWHHKLHPWSKFRVCMSKSEKVDQMKSIISKVGQLISNFILKNYTPVPNFKSVHKKVGQVLSKNS
jgi:hypothetical protein